MQSLPYGPNWSFRSTHAIVAGGVNDNRELVRRSMAAEPIRVVPRHVRFMSNADVRLVIHPAWTEALVEARSPIGREAGGRCAKLVTRPRDNAAQSSKNGNAEILRNQRISCANAIPTPLWEPHVWSMQLRIECMETN